MSTNVYDFIIVGARPAGLSLVSRLARSRARPLVFLLEAGEENDDIANRIAGKRLAFWATNGTHLDYGYKTAPQTEIRGRKIPYARGKGPGGSTMINCGIKNYHNETPVELENFVKLDADSHGKNSPVDVSLPRIWTLGLKDAFEALSKYRVPLNPDINSKKFIGIGMPPATTHRGLRITAASAYLGEKPVNLTVKTNSRVARVIFEGKKAVGVELCDTTRYLSTKDTILSAGSIDTPKILMLLGIDALEHLKKHNIPIILV